MHSKVKGQALQEILESETLLLLNPRDLKFLIIPKHLPKVLLSLRIPLLLRQTPHNSEYLLIDSPVVQIEGMRVVDKLIEVLVFKQLLDMSIFVSQQTQEVEILLTLLQP